MTPEGTVRAMKLRYAGPAVAVAVLLIASPVIGWAAAERTRPGVCMVEQHGTCVYELTPARGDRVTVRLEMDNVQPRGQWTVPGACLRPGATVDLPCPDWMVNWSPDAH